MDKLATKNTKEENCLARVFFCRNRWVREVLWRP